MPILSLQVAVAILKAAEIRENSYNHAKADAMQKTAYPNFAACYEKSLEQACTEACPDLSGLLHPMLYSCWNDAISWAETIRDGA